MKRVPRTLAGASIVVLAGSTLAPPLVTAAAAQSPPPIVQQQGLFEDVLGGLGDTLDSLLGTEEQAQLQGLLALLQGGQDPTGEALAPLAQVLGQLGGADGLAPATQALVQQLAALLQSAEPGETLDPSLLSPVAALLRQLSDTVSPTVAGLLDGLADALDDGEVPSLPIPPERLALDPADVATLERLLQQLASGEELTRATLAPVLELLREIAATPGLPSELADLIGGLIAAIDGTTGAIDPLVAGQLRAVASLVGQTAGVPVPDPDPDPDGRTPTGRAPGTPNGGTPAPRGGGTPAPGGGTPNPGGGSAAPGGGRGAARAATSRDRAVVTRVTLNRARTVASVRIACPRRAPSACNVTATAALRPGGRAVRGAKRTRIGAGRAKLVKLRLARRATRRIARRGTRLSVKLTTRFPGRRFGATKVVKVKKRAAAVRR